MRWIVATWVLAAALLFAPRARAFNHCDESCAYIAYGMVTIGGLVTAAGAQVSLLEGEPDPGWAYSSLALSGANALTSGVLLLVGGIMSATDDDDADVFLVWGGIQTTLAIAGLVSGATAASNLPPTADGGGVRAQPAAAGLSFSF